MEVMNLPGSGNANANANGSTNTQVDPQLFCELCCKAFNRRDLLMRHRRRCKGPIKPINRRKACDACFQAKVKCCYTQPICTRCTKRGTPCIYATSSEQQNEPIDIPPSSHNFTNSQPESTALSQFFDLPTWDFSSPPYSADAFDMAMADLADPPLDVRAGFDTTQSLLTDESMVSKSSGSSGMPIITPAASSSNESASSVNSPASSAATNSLVRILSGYSTLLMKGSFSTPILHLSMYSLYSNMVPDMTYLPQTSMAICCSSGVNNPDTSRFFRRAIDAAQQRLIGSFPTSTCMQQWDYLHAMLIYESMGLRESIRDVGESRVWSHDPKVQGLGSPFLRKMVGVYAKPYSQIRNPDVSIFIDPSSSPCTAATSPWARWRITETARRTVFFANILNYYSNRDLSTGKQVPYYEPLEEDLILNMPLPCSHAAWVARDEEEWNSAVRNQLASKIDTGAFNGPGCEALSSETLKNILSRFSKEYLQAEFGSKVGFGDSDELRRLIILCSCEQFVS